jgi:hypothetical protein
MPKSKINTVLLEQFFESNSKRAFTFSDLESILLEHAQRWYLPRSMTPQTFVGMLLSKTKLREPRKRRIVDRIWRGKVQFAGIGRQLIGSCVQTNGSSTVFSGGFHRSNKSSNSIIRTSRRFPVPVRVIACGLLVGKIGWGGWTRTNTVLINSEVPYRLDHAPADSHRPVGSSKDKHSTQNAQARGEEFYFVASVGKPASVQERQPPSMEMQFV